jgi:protein-disulfide isomerase
VSMSTLVKTAALMALAALAAGAAQTPPLTGEQRAELERWWDSQPKINLPFENNGAKVLIVEFTDLQCPHCRAKYVELKPILDKYAGRPKDVRFLLKHWPISSTCNPRVPSNPHVAACDAAAAVVMARPKGTADTLVDWFFVHQDELSPTTVRRVASETGHVTDFDTQYPRAIQEVKTDVALGAALGVDSTPSFFLNARRIPGGGVAPQYFEALIDLELKRAK